MSGRAAEDRVLEYYQKIGFTLEARWFDSPFGEIDLWLTKPGLHLLLEVKTLLSDQHLNGRVGAKQLRRLANTLLWMNEKYARPQPGLFRKQPVRVELRVVFVRPQGKWIELRIEDLVPVNFRTY